MPARLRRRFYNDGLPEDYAAWGNVAITVHNGDVYENTLTGLIYTCIDAENPSDAASWQLTTPKVYRALLSQTSTDDPVATVLQNSLGGTVVWTRVDTGQYLGTLASAFPASKVAILINPGESESGTAMAHRASNNAVQIDTWAVDSRSDGMLAVGTIEILVYP